MDISARSAPPVERGQPWARLVARAGKRMARRIRFMRERQRRLRELLRTEYDGDFAAGSISGLPHVPSPSLAPGVTQRFVLHDNFR